MGAVVLERGTDMRHLVIGVALGLLATCPALAAEEAKLPRIEVAPNFNAASVYVYFEWQEGKDASCRMEYKAGEAKEFRPGHSLSRTGKGRFSASLFGLKPDQPLEVRATLDDGSGSAKVRTAATRTRSDAFPGGTGKTYYVNPRGDDTNAGTRERRNRNGY